MGNKPDDPPQERSRSFTLGEADFKVYLRQLATQDASVQAGESSASLKTTQEGQLAHNPTGRAEAPAVSTHTRYPYMSKGLGVQLSKDKDTAADCEILAAADDGGGVKPSVPQEATGGHSLTQGQIPQESEMLDNDKNARLEAQMSSGWL